MMPALTWAYINIPGGVYNPRGHKYVRDFNTEPIPNTLYRVGGVLLRKEMIFAESHDRMMIRYTLEDAHSPTKLRFNPFLAFRNIHKLSKANFNVNDKHTQGSQWHQDAFV